MNVVLEPEQERFVRTRVGSGKYKSETDVVNEALLALEEQENRREDQIRLLNEKLKEGLDSIERGDTYDGDSVFDEILAELDAQELATQPK